MISGLAIGGVAIFAGGCGEMWSSPVDHPARPPIQTEADRPPLPKHLDVATPAQEAAAKLARSAPARAKAARKPVPEVKVKDIPPGEMPAASAGTNGSFTPRPRSERRSINAQTMAGYEGLQAGEQAVLLGRTALAPPGAPQPVKAAISAANQIVGRPYVWGGGHGSWYSKGYDCSGAVSYALGGGGLLSAPLDSTGLEKWGAPGPGRWITVYANAGHAYAVIAGLRWDTVGDARGTGPRWHAELPYPKGFVVRHPPGY
jgi:cell wall-associated NlpC family hydrolase